MYVTVSLTTQSVEIVSLLDDLILISVCYHFGVGISDFQVIIFY